MRAQQSNEVPTRRRWWLLIDVIVVLAFVLIGRESHDDANMFVDVLQTAAPFIVGLGAGWVITWRWRDLLDVRTGVVVAAATVLVGLTVRRLVFGEGIALPFVIVTTLVLVTGLVGSRVLIATAGRHTSARQPGP